MSLLEQFVNNVRTLSSQGNFNSLCEMIRKTREGLSRNSSHLDTVLATLDLQNHSLGVLAVLLTKLTCTTVTEHDYLFDLSQQFITECNGEQVRFAPDLFAEFIHAFTNMLVEQKWAMRGILLVNNALHKIQLHSTQLTTIHADLCLLCLVAKCPKPALQVLHVDITDISKEFQMGTSEKDPRYFLLYYYYGGLIYSMMKQWSSAQYMLELCVTTPGMAISHIMLEAYKKYILVCLIQHGKFIALPKYTSHTVGRCFKQLCAPYHDLVQVYCCNNPNEVRATVNKHQEVFTRDKNMGLVSQCLTSLYKKSIKRLTKTFLTLSLSDMSSRVQLQSPQQAEKYIFHMIEDGEIFATINKKDGMVVFHDNPEKYNNPEMLNKIDQQMGVCMDLDSMLGGMEEEICLSAEYVRKTSGVQEEDGAITSIKSHGSQQQGGGYKNLDSLRSVDSMMN